MDQLRAIVAHARHVPVGRRSAFAAAARDRLSPGSLLVETCHRVEVYGDDGGRLAAVAPPGSNLLRGEAVANHIVRLAVGRESVVLAEDQVLHQLRSATQSARRRGPLPPALDRLLDVALRAGRRARSWLPARRPSLVDVALDRVVAAGLSPPRSALVVGTGEMGRRSAHAIAARGAAVTVASRTRETAAALAAEVVGRHVEFVPPPEVVGRVDGVLIALAGPWPAGEDTAEALLRSDAWVVDLSAPPSLPVDLGRRLGRRLVSIDDLVDEGTSAPSDRLIRRLDALVEEAVGEYRRWLSDEPKRVAARALDERAEAARSAELAALWRRMPPLEPAQREEVERMARHLTERLLRDPLEQLRTDEDGRHARAARELFRL